MAPYQPAPPPSSPFGWGDGARVRTLLGEAFDLEIEEQPREYLLISGVRR
jgi:hypothetical protein